ncbi:MAG: S1C family serine protease [Terriglobales bacterium]
MPRQPDPRLRPAEPRHAALRPVILAVLLAGAFIIYTTVLRSGPRLGPRDVKLIEAAPQTQFRPAELRDIDIYRKLRPSVVSITTRLEQWSLLFGPVPEEGQGSGFIINSDGYILTNFHVIRGATRLRVAVTPAPNQTRTYTARVVGTAPVMDLAVIQIPAQHLAAVTLGSSAHLQVGQDVLCIGNPYGLPGTMTHGIISSIRTVRDPDAGIDIVNAIQTDAPVNPGNSGGPMLNSLGQVIGIDSAIMSPTHSNIGIGFAIPIDQAKAVLHDLITYGHVERPTLGIRDYPVTPYIAQQLGLPVDHGVLVLQAAPGSPAARAGIRGGTQPGYIANTPVKFGGDIIVAINGVAVDDPTDISRILITHRAGQTVQVRLYRGQRQMTLPVVLGRAGAAAGYI